jgi:hypothetical protein
MYVRIDLYMNYDTRDYWGFGLCPSSGILKNAKEHKVSERYPVLNTETGFVSETSCSLLFLEYQTMDKVQKLSIYGCYTPSSEPFRVHMNHNVN